MKNPKLSLFFKINLFITAIIYSLFLIFNTHYTISSFLLALFGAISSTVILYIIIYIVLIPFSFTKKAGFYISAIIFVAIDIALVVDFFIYKIFNFHINAMVLNILTSPDALDSIEVGKAPFFVFIAFVALFIYLEFWLIKKILNLQSTNSLNSHLNKKIILPLILIVLIEKVGYGLANLYSKNEITANFAPIPAYQPLTFNKIAKKYFGFKVPKNHSYKVNKNAKVKYPLKDLELNNSKSFNIFIFGIDSLKYSAVNKETTPNLVKFKKESLNFSNHYSGGNSTRFGIFSLIYGLNSTYWFSFLNAHQKPVLFDILKKLNYQIDIHSSTNTNWPEFRQTCYVDIQKSIFDKFKGKPWQKDKQNIDSFFKTLDSLSNKKPIFSFIFLDAPHGYSYPKSQNIFNAKDIEVNYIKIAKNSNELKNTIKKYKNAVHYDDTLFGKFIKKLKEKNLYNNSLIIVTADHGQEFYEYGYFGHNTSFSKGQTQVPLIIKLPQDLNITNMATNKLTSHQDITPTILSLLGVINSTQDYSNGYNLFAKDFNRSYAFSANWNNNAIITKNRVYVFSNLPNKMFKNEVRDNNYKLINDKIDTKILMQVIKENKKFLKGN